MKLINVVINGTVHRLSERAIELLNLEKTPIREIPISLKKLPPDLTILEIKKKEVVAPVVPEPVAEAPVVEVKAEPIQEVKEPVPVVVKKKGCANCGKHKR